MRRTSFGTDPMNQGYATKFVGGSAEQYTYGLSSDERAAFNSGLLATSLAVGAVLLGGAVVWILVNLPHIVPHVH